MRKRMAIAATILTASGAGFAVASAQEAPPTVTIDMSRRAVVVRGAEALKAGPVRLDFRNADRSRAGRFGSVVTLNPGQSVNAFRAALRRNDPDYVFGRGAIVAGAAVQGRPNAVVTFTAQPGKTYVVVETSSNRSSRWPLTTFTVGAETGTAVAPAPAAEIVMRDFRFDGAATLPRTGIVRFTNAGKEPHFAVAFRLRRASFALQAGLALRRGDQRRFDRYVTGEPENPQSVITSGAVNDDELTFRHAGTYMFVCFFGFGNRPHSQRGMYRAIRVQ